MTLDPQFPWWIVANTAGGIISGVALAALKPVARSIARWRASKLPDKLHAERIQEELEGLIAEFTAMERAQIVLRLLLDRSALRPKTGPQVGTSSWAILRDLAQRDKAFLHLCAAAYIRTEDPRTPSNRIKPMIPLLLYMAIIHPRAFSQLIRASKVASLNDEISLPLIAKVVEIKMRSNPQHYGLSSEQAANIKGLNWWERLLF